MLAKKNRFQKPDKKIWSEIKKRKISTGYFDILYGVYPTNKFPKIAISVGTSVNKLSTKRHRTKRTTSEAIRETVSLFEKNIMAVVIVKKAAEGAKRQDLYRAMAEAIKEINKQI